MTPELIAAVILGMAFIAILIWALVREGQHQRIIRDLTAKIIAKDLQEYREVAEDLPPQPRKEEKKRKPCDPVLGPNC